MKKSDVLSGVSGIIKAALYPGRCICCKAPVEENESLCGFCKRHIERIDLKSRCLKCGRDKKSCECRFREFYFSGVTAPFYNAGLARKALYDFKLGNNPSHAEFFAREMAAAVKEKFRGIKFDGVYYIPISLRARLKRGFNQSRILAKYLGESLGVPVFGGVIGCRRGMPAQHSLKMSERIAVADRKYRSCGRAFGTALLVDDIMTTGSTLSAASHVLLESGAREVYCVAALMSRDRKKKNGNSPKDKELVF